MDIYSTFNGGIMILKTLPNGGIHMGSNECE